MLAIVLVVTLSADPVVPARSPSRIIFCGGLIEARQRPRLLARTAPEFEPLVIAPASFREEASGDRPRSFATVACSPSVCDDFPVTDRFARPVAPPPRKPLRDFSRPRWHRHRSHPSVE